MIALWSWLGWAETPHSLSASAAARRLLADILAWGGEIHVGDDRLSGRELAFTETDDLGLIRAMDGGWGYEKEGWFALTRRGRQMANAL
ncbi:hypothetical protein [Phenylobacterium sp.]|uniref:hypothetical protein n=1 Tax=Phenylobacterium sp. TaxID=1871053 RepID=UPI001222AC88|nr:hypothetical protein [Phenylobacterium sp.]THD62732.1 MAG: hypothetical protein E8A49_07055 [Phenylobacterium sp.]